MSNAILSNWLNLSVAMSRLPRGEQALSQTQLRKKLGVLIEWYAEFTDIPVEQLKSVEKQFDGALNQPAKSGTNGLRGAVATSVEFLRAYLEPAEIVNMSQFGATKKVRENLSKMIGRLAGFHTEKFESVTWLVDWLEKVDPLFPASTVRNKLACCFSVVKQKACYTTNKRCVFEPAIAWIRGPAVSGLAASGDCCLGSTLSSCSGGTLSCDCVSGNTGCDCKAPSKLCSQNESITVTAASLGGITCLPLDTLDENQRSSSLKLPTCLVLDPPAQGGCVLDESSSPFKGPLCQWLDPATGRFVATRAGSLDLGRVMMTTKDCTQTGFCPPNSGGCGNVC